MKAHTHYLWFNHESSVRRSSTSPTEVEKQVEVSKVREGIVLVSAMHISAPLSSLNDHESGLWDATS